MIEVYLLQNCGKCDEGLSCFPYNNSVIWKLAKLSATFSMHFIGSSINFNRLSEVLFHGHILDIFIKSWNFSFVNYKTCETFKQFQPKVPSSQLLCLVFCSSMVLIMLQLLLQQIDLQNKSFLGVLAQ